MHKINEVFPDVGVTVNDSNVLPKKTPFVSLAYLANKRLAIVPFAAELCLANRKKTNALDCAVG